MKTRASLHPNPTSEHHVSARRDRKAPEPGGDEWHLLTVDVYKSHGAKEIHLR